MEINNPDRIIKEKNVNGLDRKLYSVNDTVQIGKKAYNQALEDFAKKLKSKPYWDDEHNFQAIPIGFIDEVMEEISIK